MNTITVRCRICGVRASLVMNDYNRRMLEAQSYIVRACNSCGGSTLWEPVVSSGRLAAEAAGDIGPRVLLIDDDEAILQVMGKALSAAQCDVETANSARDAAMMLARGDYDVIVSDIRMPGFDGTQLFEFLDKHLPEYKQRVIFVTGDTGTPSTMDFLRKNNAPYLTKPVEIAELISMVKSRKVST